MNKCSLHSQVRVVNSTTGKHHFFGYYDLCPWDRGEKRILVHEADFINRLPTDRDVASVGFVNIADGSDFTKLAETRSWNWQQGARLQWLPPDYNRYVVFNDRENGKFVSVILDLETKEKKVLPAPVYAVSPDGVFALTVNFSRLERLGGYGYPGIPDLFSADPAPEKDGIYKLDLKTGEQALIISIKEVATFGVPKPKETEHHHYLTHPLFNKNGTRFCFLHRFKLDDGGQHTRLFAANTDGSDLYCIAEGNLSHFDWFSDNEIFIWGRHRPFLTNLRKRNLFKYPIFRPLLSFVRSKTKGFLRHRVLGDQCLVFKDKSSEVRPIGIGALTEDGHFTRFKDSPWILGDTYPDENHYRDLFLYNLKTNKKIILGKFYSLPAVALTKEGLLVEKPDDSGWDLSAMRADLHPRFNWDGTKVVFDSVHEGSRQMYVLDVGQLTNN